MHGSEVGLLLVKPTIIFKHLKACRIIFHQFFNKYCGGILIVDKKRLKIPKGQSESVYQRRTDKKVVITFMMQSLA
jgi:hypothetical protein